MPKIAEIWNRVAKTLQSSIPEPEYNIWFSGLKLMSLDAGQAVIEAPNTFHARWLREKYLNQIQRSFEKCLRPCPEIRLLPEKSRIPEGSYPSPAQMTAGVLPAIRSDLTFDTFVPCDGNRFALACALKVATSKNAEYNPLYIFSGLSLGKTHLLHAIGNRFMKTRPGATPVYLSAKAFTSQCVTSFRKGTLPKLRDSYEGIDLLLFDDVHALSGRYKVQSELNYLFDFLQKIEKQMVFASRRSPLQLEAFDDQLTSRLHSGLLVEIEAQDQDSKVQLLKKRFEGDLGVVPEDVLFYLAASTDDTRGLIESAVRLLTLASVQNRTIDIAMAKALLRKKTSPRPKIEEIQKVVASYFNISQSDLVSNKKKRAFGYPRQLAMYTCRTLTGLSYKEIGRHFGNRDHSSVMYAVNRIQKERSRSRSVQNDLNNLNAFLT